MSEWRKADARVKVQAAALAQERQQADDRAVCAAAVREREAESAVDLEAFTSARKSQQLSEGTEPAKEPKQPATKTKRKQRGHKPPSAITGYFGISRHRHRYQVEVGLKKLWTYDTAVEAAHIYDKAALE